MLQLIKVGQYEMYRTVETELRAWVDNPLFGKAPNEPVYFLCEVHNADSASKSAIVREVGNVGDEWEFRAPFSMIHLVHDYAPELNQVMRVHGEPK
jgi:hypothetical protein